MLRTFHLYQLQMRPKIITKYTAAGMISFWLAASCLLSVTLQAKTRSETWPETWPETWITQFLKNNQASIVTVLPQTGRAERNLAEPEGTGVIVQPGNLVLTANHVLGAANRILLRKTDGSVIEAKIFLRDQSTDLALLEINETLKAIEFEEGAQIGENVCAYGNAFGLGMSLSCGIVSATDKRGIGFNRVEDFVQTDAAINPGMSGAPLFKENGKLAGLVTAIFTKKSDGNLGVNFASSTRLIKAFLEDAKDGVLKPVRAGMIMRPAPFKGETGRAGGLVMRVLDNSAEKIAGIQQGDLVIKAGDLDVRSQADYLAAIALSQKEKSLDLTLVRGKNIQVITIKQINP